MSCADRVGAFIDAELVNPTIKGTVTLDKTAASTIYDGIKEFADAGLTQSIKEGLEAALEKGISTSKLEVTGDVKVTDAVLNKWATSMKDTILENVEEKLKGAVLENVKLDEESVKHVVKVMTDQKFYTEFVDGIMEEVAKDAESLFEELKLHEVDIFSPKIDGGEITKAKAEGLTSNDTTLTGTTTVSGEVIMDDAVLTILLKQLTDRLGFDHLTNTAGNKFNGQGIATKCDIDALREMLIERTTLYDCHGNPHGPQAQFMDCATVNELVNDKVDGLESKLKEEGVPGRVFDCAGNLHPLNAGFMNCDQTKAAIKEMGDTKADAEETKKKFGNLQDVADDHEGRIGKLEETSGWKLKGSDGKPLAKDSSLYTKEEIDLMQGGEGSEVGAELIKRVETLEGKTPHGCDGNELAPKTGLVTCNRFDTKVEELEGKIEALPSGGTTVHGCDDKPLADGTKVVTCDEHAEFVGKMDDLIDGLNKTISDSAESKQDKLMGCNGLELPAGAKVPTCDEVKDMVAGAEGSGVILDCGGAPHAPDARFMDCEGTIKAIKDELDHRGITPPAWEDPEDNATDDWLELSGGDRGTVYRVLSTPPLPDGALGSLLSVKDKPGKDIPDDVDEAWTLGVGEDVVIYVPAGEARYIGTTYNTDEDEEILVSGTYSIAVQMAASTYTDCAGDPLPFGSSIATCEAMDASVGAVEELAKVAGAAAGKAQETADKAVAQVGALEPRVEALEKAGGSGNHGPIEEHTTTDEAMWYDLGKSDKDRYLVVDAVDPNKPHNSRKWGLIVEKTLANAPDNSSFDATWNFVGAKYEWDANTNSALLKLDANKPYIISSIIKPDSNVGAERMLSAATFLFHYVDFTGEEKPTLKDCSGNVLPDGASVATCADMSNAISPVEATAANADKVAKEAKATADSANTKATDAAAKATTADSKATDAATKADAAKSAADVAQAAATNAAQEASKASTAANEAKGEAADAIAQVGELEARVAQNTEKVGEAAKTAGDAKDEVEALEPRVKALEDAGGGTGGVTLPIDGGDVRMGANAIFDDALVPEELAWEGHRVNITDVAKRGPFVIAAHGGLPDVGLPLQVVTYDRYTGYEMKHPLTILGHQAYFDGGDFAGIFFDDSDTYLEAPEDWDVSLTRISVLSGVTATEALGIVASQALSAGHAAINGGGGSPPGAQEVEVPKDIQDLAYTPADPDSMGGGMDDMILLETSASRHRTLENGYEEDWFNVGTYLDEFYQEDQGARPAAVWIDSRAYIDTPPGTTWGGWMVLADESNPDNPHVIGATSFPGMIRMPLEYGDSEEAYAMTEHVVLRVARPADLQLGGGLTTSVMAVRSLAADQFYAAEAANKTYEQLTGAAYKHSLPKQE